MRIDDTLTTQDFDRCFDDQPVHGVSVADVIARGQLEQRQARRRTRTVVAASIAAVLAVSGVVGGWALSGSTSVVPAGPAVTTNPAGPSTAPSPFPSVEDQGFLLPPGSPRRIAYGVDLSDPIDHPPSSTPVGKTEAIDVATRVRGGPKNGPPQAALREVSSTEDSTFTAKPSQYWVVTWFFRGGRPMGLGRPMGTPSPGQTPSAETWEEWANSRCVAVVMVNATTGRPAPGLTEICTRN